MERLTNKNKTLLYSEKNQINLAREKNGVDAKTIYYGKPIESLAEFEDLLEDLGVESVEELKRILTTNAVWQENQALKDRWEKLKEYIIKEINKDGDSDFACAEEDILDKMRELELADLIRRKEK